MCFWACNCPIFVWRKYNIYRKQNLIHSPIYTLLADPHFPTSASQDTSHHAYQTRRKLSKLCGWKKRGDWRNQYFCHVPFTQKEKNWREETKGWDTNKCGGFQERSNFEEGHNHSRGRDKENDEILMLANPWDLRELLDKVQTSCISKYTRKLHE